MMIIPEACRFIKLDIYFSITITGWIPLRPVISVSRLTLFIRHSYSWNLQCLSNVLLKLRFSSLWYRWPWLILANLFRPFSFLAPKYFQMIFWLLVYLLTLVPETQRGHILIYLRFYCIHDIHVYYNLIWWKLSVLCSVVCVCVCFCFVQCFFQCLCVV